MKALARTLLLTSALISVPAFAAVELKGAKTIGDVARACGAGSQNGRLYYWRRAAKSSDAEVDYVLARPLSNWRIVDSRAIDDRLASDHRPVLVELEWIGKK